MTRLVSEDVVRASLTMAACVDAVETAYAAYAAERFDIVERRTVTVPDTARLHTYSAASRRLGYLFAMTYSGLPGGVPKDAAQLRARQKLMTLFSTRTGECVAVIGGNHLTWLDTGATGAVAIRQLARPDASCMAIIGAGRQASASLHGAVVVRDLDEVRVTSRDPEHRRRFAEEHAHLANVRPVASAAEAVDGADIVVTATTSTTPVLHADWLGPDVHVNAIGAHYPSHRELDASVLRGARVVVDVPEVARLEKGELILASQEGSFSMEQIEEGLGDVILASVPRSGRTVFCSCGTAVEAFGAAVAAYEAVTASGHDYAFA